MSKILTDEKLIDTFLSRGVENIYPTKQDLKKKLMSGSKIRVYQGFDPSGPFLHVGHAMGIRALRILQQLGHEVIFLVGDYTAKVGDPDPAKEKARDILSDEQIQKNMQGWKEQAGQLIEFEGDNPVLFKRNSEWLSKLKLADLIELMSHATVQQMIERDLFQKRLKENTSIKLQEFLYPLMQGFDSVAMEADLEIGGNDQTFNMLMGRQLVRDYLNKEKYVRTNEMMDAPDGRTMSKSKGNGINLADSPEDMYGKGMSYRDELITKGLRLLTNVEMQDIWDIEKQIEKGANPMEFKKLMSFEIVKEIKGEKLAKQAQKHFEESVQNKKVLDEDIRIVDLSGEMTILNALTKASAAGGASGSQLRRLIDQGGVEVNEKKVTDAYQIINFTPNTLIKVGKREYLKSK